MTGRIVFFRRIGIFPGALFACLAIAPPTHAAVSCGDVLTSSTTLNADLDCSGDGLVIGADGMTLDCAGHAVRGQLGNDTAGVRIEDHASVTIRRCAISGFARAVHAERAPDFALLDNLVADNRGGILIDAADRVRIESNRFERQLFQILIQLSPEPRVVKNSFVPGRFNRTVGSNVSLSTSPNAVASDNEFLGPGSIFINAVGAAATGAVVERNTFGSAPSGIDVIGASACRVVANSFNATPGPPVSNGPLIQLYGSRDCVVARNHAAIRAIAGVFLTNDFVIGADGNTIVDNEFEDVGYGVLVLGGSGNRVERNRLTGQVGILVEGSGVSVSDGNRVERNDIDAEYGILVADADDNSFERNRVSGARYGILETRFLPSTPVHNVYRRNEITDSGIFGMLVFGESPLIVGNTFARNGAGPAPSPGDDLIRTPLGDARGGLALLPVTGSGYEVLDDGDPSNDHLPAPTIGGALSADANTFVDNGDVDILMVDSRAANATTLDRDNRFRGTPTRIRQDWFALIRVQDELGGPVAGAAVAVRDALGAEIGRWETDEHGIAPPGRDPARSQGISDAEPGGPVPPWARVTEYTLDGSGRIRFGTPHRITAETASSSGCATYSWNGVADRSDDGSSIDGRYQTARVVLGTCP